MAAAAEYFGDVLNGHLFEDLHKEGVPFFRGELHHDRGGGLGFGMRHEVGHRVSADVIFANLPGRSPFAERVGDFSASDAQQPKPRIAASLMPISKRVYEDGRDNILGVFDRTDSAGYERKDKAPVLGLGVRKRGPRLGRVAMP